jgi:hypothetical protein
VFWRRPEPTLIERDVDAMFRALSDIRRMCAEMLAILREEDDGEAEADEP